MSELENIKQMINSKDKKKSKLNCSELKIKMNEYEYLAYKENKKESPDMNLLSVYYSKISTLARIISNEYLAQAKMCHKMPALLYCVNL